MMRMPSCTITASDNSSISVRTIRSSTASGGLWPLQFDGTINLLLSLSERRHEDPRAFVASWPRRRGSLESQTPDERIEESASLLDHHAHAQRRLDDAQDPLVVTVDGRKVQDHVRRQVQRLRQLIAQRGRRLRSF